MIEANGFTGRVWEATPADKLVRDLITGPGVLPMADAGVAFGELSTILGEAAAEYHVILGEVADAWRSAGSEAGVQRLAALRNWMAEAAEAAAVNAARAEAQAAAYTTAVAAMPGEAEQAVLQALKDMAAQHIPLGGALLGAAASLEDQAHVVRSVAAQVMCSYEAATAPVAQPWTASAPPVLTSDSVLAAEQQHGEQQRVAAASAAMPPLPVETGYPSPAMLSMPAAALGEHTPVDGDIEVGQQVVETAGPPVQFDQGPMVPGLMAPSLAADVEDRSSIRPAAGASASADADALGITAGWTGTPPVLGGVAAQMRTGPAIQEGT